MNFKVGYAVFHTTDDDSTLTYVFECREQAEEMVDQVKMFLPGVDTNIEIKPCRIVESSVQTEEKSKRVRRVYDKAFEEHWQRIPKEERGNKWSTYRAWMDMRSTTEG